MSKHISYYLSEKASVDLDPIDSLTPEAKVTLSRHLLNLASVRPGQKIEGIALTERIAQMIKAAPVQIERMSGYQIIRLAGAILITACDEMSIEREELISFGGDSGAIDANDSIDIFLEPA